jgi:hypothetical protein
MKNKFTFCKGISEQTTMACAKLLRTKIIHCQLLISFLLLSSNCFCQGIDNLWMMGYDSWAGLPWGGLNWDFSSPPVNIALHNRKMDFYETNASICDKSGNLLFATNGIWIENATDDTMQNGSGFNPGYLTSQYQQDGLPLPQAALIIPYPNDSTKYYLFHETVKNFNLGYPTEINFSAIDMTLDNGLGGLLIKDTLLFADTIAGSELMAAKHGNGRDWWLLQHKLNSDLFYSFLISPSGISGPYTQHIGIVRQTGYQAAFSPDGKKYASYNNNDDVEIFDFDRCSGLLSNYIHVNINDSMVGGGIAFAPGGRYLYASSAIYIYQLDLQATNVAASMQTVAIWDGTYSPNPPFAATFLLMQLARDGKIYINCQNGTLVMHQINYPDSAGLSCNLQQHSVLLPAFNAYSIPNYPNYFLSRDLGSPCDSLTNITEIKDNTIPIRINPNPAQNSFSLNYKLPYGRTAVATVYNTLGKEVMRKGLYWYFGYLQIDCSNLSDGVYFVEVKGEGVGGNAKLVIAR